MRMYSRAGRCAGIVDFELFYVIIMGGECDIYSSTKGFLTMFNSSLSLNCPL